MAGRVELDDTRLRHGLALAVQTAAERAAEHLVAEIRDRIDTYALVITAAGQGRLFSGKSLLSGREGTHYRWDPSAPGTPPHLRTGTLHGSIAYTSSAGPGEIVVRVGTPVPYGLPLEEGAPARNLAARPYLASTLAETAPVLAQVFAAALRGELAGGGPVEIAVAAE